MYTHEDATRRQFYIAFSALGLQLPPRVFFVGNTAPASSSFSMLCAHRICLRRHLNGKRNVLAVLVFTFRPFAGLQPGNSHTNTCLLTIITLLLYSLL